MSVVLTPQRWAGLDAFAAWRNVWSRVGVNHLVAVLIASLLMAVIDASIWVDKLGKPGVALVMTFGFLGSVLLYGLTVLAWVAVTSDIATSGPARTWRLAWAIIGSALLAAAIIVPVSFAIGLPELMNSLGDGKKPLPPMWLALASHATVYSTFSFLFVAVAEVCTAPRDDGRAASDAARAGHDGTRSARIALAAMQAQVEPQFLFDSLVDIETLYQKDASRAAEDLDRLITYLRVALPRLREPGSTICAEIDLVHAYLGVVTSLHGGRPVLSVTLPEDCRQARFYPMLLLPLLQRAVRNPSGVMPESIRIGISRINDQIVIVLRFNLPDHCNEDPELARVRERLSGLFGAYASLACEQMGDVTQITMRVPAAGATKK